MKKLLIAAALWAVAPALGASSGQAQEPAGSDAPEYAAGEKKADDKKWDVAAPPLPVRQVSIDVDEGTWMNLDVSPDGRTIAFDLLGDIYTLPIGGGAATRIAAGLPFEMQPKFSPDGTRIAFTSDRGGGDNIWIMNRDGSDVRQVTKESFRLITTPAWSPDGMYIAARKHFTTARSLGTGEIWLYHLGGGDGVKLVARASEQLQKELGEPVFTPDGKGVYYTRNTTPGNTFIYAQDTNAEVFAIERIDIASGEVTKIVGGPGGAVRPTPSPDGRRLAFVKRERGKSKLYAVDLRSGEIVKLYDHLDQDLQETWAVHGVYPSMAWTPDSRSLVFWAGGKIRRVDMAGNAREIPFRVSDTRDVIDPPRPEVAVAPAEFDTAMPRFAAVSPNGRQAVFESLGKLWIRTLPDGAPRRLTSDNSGDFEFFPAWSRDGSRIVFVQWSDEALGRIRTVAASGGGARDVTGEPGHYRRPQFSPDGRLIVFEKGAGGHLLSDRWSKLTGVFRIPASGGAMTKVTDTGAAPHFGAASDRVFLNRRVDNAQRLVSVTIDGFDERVHASGDMAIEFIVSPKGDHVAFRESHAAYVMPMTPGPQNIAGGKAASAVPVIRASEGGSTWLNWSGDGAQLNWSLGPTLYSARLADMIPAAPKPPKMEGAEDAPAYKPPTQGVSLSMRRRADAPGGRLALVGARVISMADESGGVIEDGVILVNGNRIEAVGPRGAVSIPAGARTVDVAGKTIIPGLIDAHAHGPQGEGEIIPQTNWSAIAHLALGVTTIHDPSNAAAHIFPAAEMQRAGVILAPRIFSTGNIVYGAKSPGAYAEINSYDDALNHVRRLKVQGAHSIKNYNQPRRDQRQQVVKAAIEENMAVVAEGGSLFTMDMTIIADGNTALEHNIPQMVFYEDVLSFYSQTNVAYTPTLGVTYGGLAGDPYWRYATDVWRHPILSRHVPPHVLQPQSVRRTKAPEEDFVEQYAAREAKKLADRGVFVSIGAHGQQEGLAAHWEMWSFARGGMSPLEALGAATVAPAKHLGFWRDIGSLEPGKLADLVVLDADPLADIRNSDKVVQVMLNGRLYEALTMNETVTGTRKRGRYYWEGFGTSADGAPAYPAGAGEGDAAAHADD